MRGLPRRAAARRTNRSRVARKEVELDDRSRRDSHRAVGRPPAADRSRHTPTRVSAGAVVCSPSTVPAPGPRCLRFDRRPRRRAAGEAPAAEGRLPRVRFSTYVTNGFLRRTRYLRAAEELGFRVTAACDRFLEKDGEKGRYTCRLNESQVSVALSKRARCDGPRAGEDVRRSQTIGRDFSGGIAGGSSSGQGPGALLPLPVVSCSGWAALSTRTRRDLATRPFSWASPTSSRRGAM